MTICEYPFLKVGDGQTCHKGRRELSGSVTTRQAEKGAEVPIHYSESPNSM